jgi:hypothetical protein
MKRAWRRLRARLPVAVGNGELIPKGPHVATQDRPRPWRG